MNDKYLSPFLDNRNRLFENEIGFVIYDGYPVSTGHCLIIPKRVYPDFFDSTLEELKGLNELIFKTKEFLDNKYQPTGYNIGVNSGEDSGQTVFHLRIHVRDSEKPHPEEMVMIFIFFSDFWHTFGRSNVIKNQTPQK